MTSPEHEPAQEARRLTQRDSSTRMGDYELATDGRTLLLPDGTILSRAPDYMTPQRYEWSSGHGWFLGARPLTDAIEIECLFEDAEGEPFIVPAGDLLGARLVPTT